MGSLPAHGSLLARDQSWYPEAMRRLQGLLLIFLLAGVAQAEWVKIGTDELGASYFYETQSIERFPDFHRVYVKVKYAKPDKFGDLGYYGHHDFKSGEPLWRVSSQKLFNADGVVETPGFAVAFDPAWFKMSRDDSRWEVWESFRDL